VELILRNLKSVQLHILAAFIVLIITGAVYRIANSEIRRVTSQPVKLPRPLSSVPMEVMNWMGTEVPISETVQAIARSDDFLSRSYYDKSSRHLATIYLGYSARPRTMVGHRPDICYKTHGWIFESSQRSEFKTQSGIKVPCLVHKFHRPTSEGEQITVINFYVINGKFSINESDFSGLGWRTPNINGDPAHYAAHIQISSLRENSVRKLAEEITDTLMEYLPDVNGKVAAGVSISNIE